MKQLFAFVVFSCILIFNSCSIPNLYENDDILVTKELLKLRITNNSNETIYYFIVEQETAAVINWAPTLNGPSIQSGKHAIVQNSDIFVAENQTLKKGSKVIIYYWTSSLKSIYDVNGFVIEL
jgi:hypothetical protein